VTNGWYPENPNLGQEIQGAPGSGLRVDKGFLAHYQAVPIAAADDYVHAAITLAIGATQTITANITNPDVSRILSITGNAATAVGNVVIVGTNAAGVAITETIVSTGAATVAGLLAFKTVASITVPAQGAGGDTISVGVGDALGLNHYLTHNTVLASYLNNVLEATAAAVTVSATVLEENTVVLDTALDGTVVDIYYMV